MSADPHWEKLKEIFHAALALAPDERTAYLDRACDGDTSLRVAVESLLKSHEETAQVLKVSPGTVMRDWTFARAWLKNEMRAAS